MNEKYRERLALIFEHTNFDTRAPSAPWPSKTPAAKSPGAATPPSTKKNESWFSFATPFTPPATVAAPATSDEITTRASPGRSLFAAAELGERP